MTQTSPALRRRLPALVVLGALAAAAVATILSTPWIFTNDGAQHVLSAELERTWGEEQAAEDLLQRHHPPSSNGFSTLYRLFAGWLGWRHATQAVLIVLALSWFGGFTALVRSVRPDRLWVAVLGAATALNWCFYMGLFNFLAGTSFGLFLVAASIRADPRRPIHYVVLAGALSVGVWIHLFATALTGLAMLFVALASARERRARRIWATLLAGAPAALYAGVTALAFQEVGGVMETDWRPNALLNAPAFFAGGPWWRSIPILLTAVAGLITGGLRLRRGDLSAAERGLLITSLVFLALAAATPFHLPRWQYFSPRFLPLGVLAAAALFPVERFKAGYQAAGAVSGLILICVSSLGWSYGLHARMDRSCRPVVDALETGLDRGGLRVGLVLEECDGALVPDLDGELRYQQPLMHLDALMASAQGGVAAGLWSTRAAIHPFRFRDGVRERLPGTGPAIELRRARAAAGGQTSEELSWFTDSVLSWYGSRAVDAADLVLWSSRDRDWFVARGFAVDYADGPLSILRFEGCDLIIRLDGILNRPSAILVEYGWYPLEAAQRSLQIPWEGFEEGRMVVPVTAAPCGPLWIRIQVNEPDGRRWICEGADPSGRVIMRNTPERRGLVCSLVEATPGPDPDSSR